jgi:hypothetical protein
MNLHPLILTLGCDSRPSDDCSLPAITFSTIALARRK